MVRFVVKKDGSVHDVKAVTMEGSRLAEIAVNAIKGGPRQIPAGVNGHKVNAYWDQPVKLDNPFMKNVFPADSAIANLIFSKADKEPQFSGPGGWDNYLFSELKKKMGKNNKDKGVCKISFVVDQNGKVRDVNTLLLGGTYNHQAITDVFKRSPQWEPATYNNQKVPFLFTVTLTIDNASPTIFVHPNVIKDERY